VVEAIIHCSRATTSRDVQDEAASARFEGCSDFRKTAPCGTCAETRAARREQAAEPIRTGHPREACSKYARRHSEQMVPAAAAQFRLICDAVESCCSDRHSFCGLNLTSNTVQQELTEVLCNLFPALALRRYTRLINEDGALFFATLLDAIVVAVASASDND